MHVAVLPSVVQRIDCIENKLVQVFSSFGILNRVMLYLL